MVMLCYEACPIPVLVVLARDPGVYCHMCG